ncbi:hypothetical protein GCM10027446_14240 [Angustibacter peucedani]
MGWGRRAVACALPVVGVVVSTASGVAAWNAGSAARWRAAEPGVQRQLHRTLAMFELPSGFAVAPCADHPSAGGTATRCWTSPSTGSPAELGDVVLAALRRTGVTRASWSCYDLTLPGSAPGATVCGASGLPDSLDFPRLTVVVSSTVRLDRAALRAGCPLAVIGTDVSLAARLEPSA